MAKKSANDTDQPSHRTQQVQNEPHVGWATLSEWMVFTPGAFSDGGGFVIYLGKDWKVHVKRIPPWDPQVRSEISAALALLDHTTKIQNATIAARLERAAEEIIQTHVDEVAKVASAPIRDAA